MRGNGPHRPRSRRDRFFAGYLWLILKNVIGWTLILVSFVAGPLVPGPGGIPLFLVGFALVSFPGKRRLTARVLRGRPFRFPRFPFAAACVGVALGLPALASLVVHDRPRWLAKLRDDALARGPFAAGVLYLIVSAVTWAIVRLTPHALNTVLRVVAKGRRKFRPWLHRHRIRLLPPRWRRRHPHEPGSGPLRLTDEILKFGGESRDRGD